MSEVCVTPLGRTVELIGVPGEYPLALKNRALNVDVPVVVAPDPDPVNSPRRND